MSRKSDLLINTKDVLILLTPLAVLVGDREAIALQQIHYWLELNKDAEKHDTHFFEDQWWAFNTWNKWREKNFPFWSVATIQRVFESLVNKGLIVLRAHEQRNKGQWVTICYDALEAFKTTKKERKKRESKRVRSSQTDNTRSSQTDMTLSQSGLVKLTTPGSQTDMTLSNTETTSETTFSDTSDSTANAGAMKDQQTDTPQETTFDDIPGYMESRAVHGAVYNRQQAFKLRIAEVWEWPVGSTQNTHREQQLRGVATKGEWKECNLPVEYAKQLEPDDLPHWKTWELERMRRDGKTVFISAAAPVQASIMAYIDAGKPRVGGEPNKPTQSKMVKITELYELEGAS